MGLMQRCCDLQLKGVVHAADGVGVLAAIAAAAEKHGAVAQLAAAADLTAAERMQLRAFLLQVTIFMNLRAWAAPATSVLLWRVVLGLGCPVSHSTKAWRLRSLVHIPAAICVHCCRSGGSMIPGQPI